MNPVKLYIACEQLDANTATFLWCSIAMNGVAITACMLLMPMLLLLLLPLAEPVPAGLAGGREVAALKAYVFRALRFLFGVERNRKASKAVAECKPARQPLPLHDLSFSLPRNLNI